jgi:hypothetical protein
LNDGERVTSCFPVLDGDADEAQEGAPSAEGVAADGVVDAAGDEEGEAS